MHEYGPLVDGYLVADNKAAYLRRWRSTTEPSDDFVAGLSGYVSRRLLNRTLTYSEALDFVTSLGAHIGQGPPELDALLELLQGAYAACPKAAGSAALTALRSRPAG